jgi:hypothetical protein
MEPLYRKIGRKYHQVSEWYGDPADGIWLVQGKPGCKSMRLITRIGELPDVVPLVNLELRRDEVCKVVSELRQFSSTNDIVTAVFKVLATK